MPEAEPKVSDQAALIRTFLGRALEAFTARTTWFQNQLKSQSIRRGILQDLNWPYPGASNPNIPVTDAIVRRKKAAAMSVLSLRPPVVIEIPQENVSERLDWRLQQWMTETYDQMRIRRRYEVLVDGWLERSSFFVKEGRRYEREYRETLIDLDRMGALDEALFSSLQFVSLPEAFAAAYKMDLADEKDAAEIKKAVAQYEAGARKIRLRRKIVAADLPDWIVITGEDLIRQAGAPKDIQEHRWLIYRFRQTVAEIRKKVQDKTYEKDALGMVENARDIDSYEGDGERSQLEQQATAEGRAQPTMHSGSGIEEYGTSEEGEVETYEAYCWWTPDPERVPARRAAFTFFPAYHNGQFVKTEWLPESYWPFQEFDYDNPSNDTYGGRSVPLMHESLAVETNMLHKSFLDTLPWIAGMAGTYDVNKLVTQNGAAMGLSPGEFLPARGSGAIEAVRAPTAGAEILAEANNLQSQSENLFGPLQTTLQRGSRGMGGKTTATEVQAQQSADNSLQAMEIDSFQESMNFVHQMTLDDMIRNMPPEVRFPYKGPGGQIMFDVIRREELEGIKPRVRAHGNLRNSNPDVETQRMTNLLSLVPSLMQFGVQVDVRKIAQRIVALQGERNPQELIPDAPMGMPGMGGPNGLQAAMGGGMGQAPPGGPAPGGPALGAAPQVPAGAGALA